MKRLIVLSIILIPTILFGQNFVMTWQQCYGGSGDDIVRSMIPYNDGYLFFGLTHSIDGDVLSNDCNDVINGTAWLVNIEKQGNILFEKSFCGFGGASGYKVLSFNDDFYFVGSTGPNNYGGLNGYWLAKLNNNFDILWQDVLGGSYVEDPRGGCIAHDGGVIGCGITGSNDGDIEEYYGTFDNWIVKMNPDGSRDWVNTYGNIGAEEGGTIIPTSDGGYIYACAGYNELPGNTYCEGHEGMMAEAWLIKMDANGEKEWHQCYGGSHIESFKEVIEIEGGYIACGYAESNDGDVNNHHGLAGENNDIWVIKTDKSGNIIWNNCFGGSNRESGLNLFPNDDGNYTLISYTRSKDGDVQGNTAMDNRSIVWMIKIDNMGQLIYQKPFPDIDYVQFPRAIKVTDYRYIIAFTKRKFGCNHAPNEHNEDIYIFEIQDMDEFIPSQPIGADKVCVENNAESIYSTQLVVDTMETQWQLIPEEAGEIINLHDSVRINWNPNYYDTAWLQVRAVNEYGESSYSESKQILLKDCTGLGEILQKQLKTYPNPATNQITFELPIITTESKLQIKDVFGKTVSIFTLFNGQAQLVWDCSNISNGVYFYQTEIDGINYSGKILIQ